MSAHGGEAKRLCHVICGMGKGRREAVKGLGLRVFSSFPFSSLSPSFFSMALEITLGLACTPGKPLTLTCTLGSAETRPHCVAQIVLTSILLSFLQI